MLFSFGSAHSQQNKDQDQKQDSVKKAPKEKKDLRPTGFRVGTDLIAIGKTFYTDNKNQFKGWELNGDVDFANYYLAADVGAWGRDIVLPNGTYHNNGNYFRAGIDVNFLGKDPDKNMFFIGFRVGHSNFNETLNYTPATTPKLFPNNSISLSQSNAKGGWGEITTGLRVKVWKGFWMGFTGRMKFSPAVKNTNPDMMAYDMPGYGIVSKHLWWGFNYQAFWRFGWRKDKPVEEKKK